MADTTKVKLTAGVKIGSDWYKPGDVFTGDAELVAQLIADGAAEDPKARDDVIVDTSAADAEAQKILDAATAEAEKIRETAKKQAEGIVNDAKDAASKAAEAAKADADKVISDAKAEAEKIKKAAQAK